ncbi:MAG: AMP-binding protein [Deltaproteobacteria bacterium]|nr:AMP-binding protein [Deltaproteobacteria bacterium]MBW1931128.1 AMP-binding protein [Deltaproteobacteria bacterium]MBW2025515.1 AMP-binding protein [Deltaproteobacteria bacterium]MBW2125419.1 AMP-binding protein [Deltaproteobacteria bacterium]
MKWPNVAEYLKAKVLEFEDALLLKDYGTRMSYSYKEFDEATDRLAWGFKKVGANPGDRIAFLHSNHTDLLLGYIGAIKAGAVAVLVNPAYTEREVAHIIADSDAKILVSTERFKVKVEIVKKHAPALSFAIVKKEGQTLEEALAAVSGPLGEENPVPRNANDPAMIFYTSGTTGSPKGVIISHRNITFAAGNMAQNYGLTASDITLICLPLNHIFANASPFWGTFASGGSVVVMERFQTEAVFDAIKNYRITWFPGVPTMFAYLLSSFDERPRDVSSLRMGLSGGASLSTEHLKAFEDKFEAFMLEVYGLTESTGLVTANPVYGIRKPGSIGIPVSGVAVRVVDEKWEDVPRGEVGELIFKGPNGTIGYWGQPEETEKRIRNGWISTGDLAYQDEEGYLYLAGRKSELIISGGYNIFPREIEEILNSHPKVLEAAVIGVPDTTLGEVPKAFIVPAPGKNINVEELEAFCKENLTKYKIPKQFVIMGELPKNATGKILKKELN